MSAGEAGATLVDARGHRCPVPTLRLRRALERAGEGACVTLLADDPMARIDVPHFAAQAGHEVLQVGAADGGALRFVVRKSPWAAGAGRAPPPG
jgi:tRNA 2-thiouridine synthesizing protein A